MRLAPGASRLSTTPVLTGSDTAEKTTGMSVPSVADCMAVATGVAMPTIRSTSSAIKLAMIWLRTVASLLQLS